MQPRSLAFAGSMGIAALAANACGAVINENGLTMPLSRVNGTQFVLIDRSMRTERITVTRLDVKAAPALSGQVVYVDGTGARRARSVNDLACLVPSWWPLNAEEAMSLPEHDPFRRSGAFETHAAAADQGQAGAEADPPEGLADAAGGVEMGGVFIELADGQRLAGRAAPMPPAHSDEAAEGGGESLRWETTYLGSMSVPLESIRRAVLAESAPGSNIPIARASDPSSDLVVLVNGDRVEGFVESIGSDVTVETRPVTGGANANKISAAPATIGIAQVAELHLSNPRRAPAGLTAWLDDRSVVRVERVETDAEGERLTVRTRSIVNTDAPAPGESHPGAAASLDLSALSGLVFDAASITSLADLPVLRQGPLGDRRVAQPAMVVAGDEPARSAGSSAETVSTLERTTILLPGPMQVDWQLPNGAARLVGWAMLDEGASIWGDCELVVALVGGEGKDRDRELARRRLNAAQPVFGINVELGRPPDGTQATLRISVEQGSDGPIMDRVRLIQPMVQISPSGR